MIDAALLLNPAQVGVCQAVVFHGVLASGLQAVLCDGGTHLLALTGVGTILLREAWSRERREQGYERETAHVDNTHRKNAP